MMPTARCLFAALFLTGFSLTWSQPEFSFVREDITFRIDDSYFCVNGFYWFTNQSDRNVEKLIYFPFGAVSDSERIDSIGIVNVSTRTKQKPTHSDEHGLSFTATIPAGDTALYNIRYRQQIAGDSVRYILMSTQTWKRPLESAEYKLVINITQVRMMGFSLQPDTLYTIGGEQVYYWKRRDFMPTSDLVFHFKD
jgi:hypothetical protein